MNTPSSAPAATWIPEAPSWVWIVALVVGLSFLASEHDVFLSTAQDYTQDADEMLATAEGGNSLRRLAFLSLAVLGGTLLVAFRSQLPRLTPLAGLMAAMAALCFASLLWSQDPGTCLRRLLVLGFALLGVLGLARLNLRELCIAALAISLGCVTIGVFCELALGTFRPWSGEYRFSGTVHPNTQGAYLAVLGLAALCLTRVDPARRKTYWCLLGYSLVLLMLTKSRTSTAGTLLALGIVQLCLSSGHKRWMIPLVGIWLGAAGMLVLLMSGSDADALLSKLAFMGRVEETESFSGRTTIWPVVQYYIAQRPWLGFGYESFWTPKIIEEVTIQCEWPVREAHSAYRELLLGLGWVGLTLYSLTALAAGAESIVEFCKRRNAAALFGFGMVVYGFINAMFESGMAWISFPTFMAAAVFARLACFQTAESSEPAWQPRRANPLVLEVTS